MTPRRVLTWAFELRTPFNSMSDAARMEATRLAPAGRACSKFVWQSHLQKTGRFEGLRARAALPFLAITNLYMPIAATILRRDDSTPRLHLSASLKHRGHAEPRFEPFLDRRSRLGARDRSRPGLPPPPRAGHVVAAIGGHSSEAEMRRTADRPDRICVAGTHRRAAPGSAAGSEFVSEFETKRDQ